MLIAELLQPFCWPTIRVLARSSMAGLLIKEPRIPAKGRLGFIKTQGRVAGADFVMATCNEILTALNKPHDSSLAFVEVNGGSSTSRLVPTPVSEGARLRCYRHK